MLKHRFNFEIASQRIIANGMDIDHINGDKNDDSWSNLQELSRVDHNVKTRTDNPLMWKKLSETKSLRVIATHIETGEESHFQSCSDAARMLGLHPASICLNLKGRCTRVGQYKFLADPAYIAEQDDLPQEEWHEIPEDRAVAYGIPTGSVKKILVSNMGRIQNKYGRRSYGFQGKPSSEDPTNHYMVIRFGFGKGLYTTSVHVLCALAFLGERPSPNHTVDHIDRQKNNNRSDNLRWCTRLEQGQNQSSNRAVHQIDMESGLIIRTYATMSEAARALTISANGIRLAATGVIKYSRGFIWEFAT